MITKSKVSFIVHTILLLF